MPGPGTPRARSALAAARAVLVGLVALGPGAHAASARDVPGPSGPPPFDAVPIVARTVAAVGDQKGDGVPDLAVGTPPEGAGGKDAEARVTVDSGKDGAVLLELPKGEGKPR